MSLQNFQSQLSDYDQIEKPRAGIDPLLSSHMHLASVAGRLCESQLAQNNSNIPLLVGEAVVWLFQISRAHGVEITEAESELGHDDETYSNETSLAVIVRDNLLSLSEVTDTSERLSRLVDDHTTDRQFKLWRGELGVCVLEALCTLKRIIAKIDDDLTLYELATHALCFQLLEKE